MAKEKKNTKTKGKKSEETTNAEQVIDKEVPKSEAGDQVAADVKPEGEHRSEADIMEEIRQAMALTPVKDFIAQFLETLSSLTYQRLGIYQESDAVIDLAQAKMAIDSYASLLGSLGDSIGEDERRVYTNVLSSLRMQYVQKSS